MYFIVSIFCVFLCVLVFWIFVAARERFPPEIYLSFGDPPSDSLTEWDSGDGVPERESRMDDRVLGNLTPARAGGTVADM